MAKLFNIINAACIFMAILSSPYAAAQNLDAANAARELALQAEAPALAQKQWERAEKSLSKANRLVEKSARPEKITSAFADATEEYDAAELAAINTKLLDPARRALRAAEDLRAERYAPITYSGAQDAFKEAEAAITADRHATGQINKIVAQARFEANYAARIARAVAGKPDTETLIRDRDYYLYRLAEAAGAEIDLDSDTEATVTELEDAIRYLYSEEQRLRNDLTNSQAFVAALEEEIRLLDDELGGVSVERRQLVMQIENQARTEEKFLQTESLFDESEADVFRQSDTIVIRLFGLEFASGSAELNKGNEPLLNKVSQALQIYPGAMISAEGHTDSQGSADMNQRLSQNRADTIAAYIVEQVKIAPHLIDATGYGASRPIANNETEKGRARNRRIDLIIRPNG